jgi:hypothetical protein
MRMPQHPARWVLTILFVALVGLTLWIAWAMDKLEERRVLKRAQPAAPAQSTTPAEPTPPAEPSRPPE